MSDMNNNRFVANADRYDPEGMAEYRRIARYAEDHGCSFEQAIYACMSSPDPIAMHPNRFDPAGMDEYRRIMKYAEAHACSFQQALAACPESAATERRVGVNKTAISTSTPGRVLVVPWGDVESQTGSFVVDEESARLIVEAFRDHRTDLVLDYEHQTLGGEYTSPTGQAPAAGWIKSLEVVPGTGIYADVEWTTAARELLTAKQYRYLSPVVLVRKQDSKATALHSVALTNKPAIVGAPALMNAIPARTKSTRDTAIRESVVDGSSAWWERSVKRQR